MLLTHLLLGFGIAMFVTSSGILSYDASVFLVGRRVPQQPKPCATTRVSPTVGWRTPVALVMLAWAPLLISAALVIAPSRTGSAHFSQTKATITSNF